MKVAVVGTGYVGLVAGVCFADAGHIVTCVDKDPEKIKQLNQGKVPIYEPGLEDILVTSRPRLTFTTDLDAAVKNNNVIFIAVGTPENADGSADMGPTLKVVNDICRLATERKFVVLKSTVPVGTAKQIKAICKESCRQEIEIISNPEFLKEGAAVDDFLKPDRVVIGCTSKESRDIMWDLYQPFVKHGNPILFMDNTSAEMTKYAANAFLSVKISFINELALLADKLGADINEVRKGFTRDSRINPAFFNPGVGFGGSCFPKDVKALVHTGKKAGVAMQVVHAADEVNDRQKKILFERIKAHFGDLKGRTIAVWGLAFKPRTDDVREAPALNLIQDLVAAGAKVRAYDPVASSNALAAIPNVQFEIGQTAMAVTEGADALAIVTEWNEFRNPDFGQLRQNLKTPAVFDGRNVLEPEKIPKEFHYDCIGRKNVGVGRLV